MRRFFDWPILGALCIASGCSQLDEASGETLSDTSTDSLGETAGEDGVSTESGDAGGDGDGVLVGR